MTEVPVLPETATFTPAQRGCRRTSTTLKAVVAEHAAMSAERAASFVDGLAKARRYCRDVY